MISLAQQFVSQVKTITFRYAWPMCASVLATSFAMASPLRPVAADTLIAQAVPAAAKTLFITSAVLRRSAGGNLFLIHSTRFAVSSDEALGFLIRSALQQFPGYTIELTTASMLSKFSGKCLKEGKPASEPAMYIVSAVFPEGVDIPKPFLLANGWVYADGIDDARKNFLALVAAKYPSPAPLRFLATELKDIVLSPCPTPNRAPSPARGKWREA